MKIFRVLLIVCVFVLAVVSLSHIECPGSHDDAQRYGDLPSETSISALPDEADDSAPGDSDVLPEADEPSLYALDSPDEDEDEDVLSGEYEEYVLVLFEGVEDCMNFLLDVNYGVADPIFDGIVDECDALYLLCWEMSITGEEIRAGTIVEDEKLLDLWLGLLTEDGPVDLHEI